MDRSVKCYHKGPCRWKGINPGKISIRVDPKSGLSFPASLHKRGPYIKNTARFNGWITMFLAGFSIVGAFAARRFL